MPLVRRKCLPHAYCILFKIENGPTNQSEVKWSEVIEATGCLRPFVAVQKYGISSMEFLCAKNVHIFFLSANSIVYCQHLATRFHHILVWHSADVHSAVRSVPVDSICFDSKSSGWCALPHTQMYGDADMRIRFRRSVHNSTSIHLLYITGAPVMHSPSRSLAKWEQSPGHKQRCTSQATDRIGSPEPMCQLGNKDEQIEQIE